MIIATGRTSIQIPRAVRQAIVRHARSEQPRECCGLLVGAGRKVLFAVPMRNVAQGTTRYRLDDRAHIALRRTLRAFVPELEIVGVYHSHPRGDAVPSETDLAEAYYPKWIYVIVGLGKTTRLTAWTIRSGRPRRLVIDPP